jgi:hypothetical protein
VFSPLLVLFSCHPSPQAEDLLLPLLLQAPLPLRLPLLPKHRNRHFDRGCSRFCEQRSGEIRFSTQSARTSASTSAIPIFSVILNAVKDPEEFRSPQPPEPFKPQSSQLPLKLNRPSAPHPKQAA